MARIARLVVPGVPHHVTRRGNRRERTFFNEADYRLYRDLLGAAAAKAGAEIWAYCLMPNHVHIIVTPKDEDSLRRTFGELHRRYTAHVNARNPVRARLVDRAEDWPWSSVRAHLRGQDDGVMTTAPVLARVGPFADFLTAAFDETGAFAALRRSETTGRPIGSGDWIKRLEHAFARSLAPRKREPKPRDAQPTSQHELLSKLSP